MLVGPEFGLGDFWKGFQDEVDSFRIRWIYEVLRITISFIKKIQHCFDISSMRCLPYLEMIWSKEIKSLCNVIILTRPKWATVGSRCVLTWYRAEYKK